MNWNPVAAVVETVAGLATKYFPSAQDRERFQADLYAQTASIQLQHDKVMQQAQEELTKRQQADMMSDSWLSKNIRPMSFIFLTALVTIVIGCAYFGKMLPESYVGQIFNMWLGFGGIYAVVRGGEKITSMIKK